MVIVVSPPDVLLTCSAYDFTRGLGFYLGPGLACRAAPGSPPPGAAPLCGGSAVIEVVGTVEISPGSHEDRGQRPRATIQ